MTEDNQEVQEDSGADSRDYEAEAASMGWTPQDQFKGDPDKFIDAQTFVERGEKFLPIVQSKLSKSEQRVQDLENQLNELKTSQTSSQGEVTQRLDRMKKMYEHAMQTQKEQLMERFEAAKLQAVEEGDVEAYNQIQQQQEQQIARFSEPEYEEEVEKLELPKEQQEQKKEQPNQLSAEDQKTVEGWVKENSEWYGKDARLTSYAQAYEADLFKQEPNLSLPERLKKVRQEVAERFPDILNIDPAPSLISGGSRMSGQSNNKKGWNDIPAGERQQLKDFIAEGLFKDEKAAAEKYWS